MFARVFPLKGLLVVSVFVPLSIMGGLAFTAYAYHQEELDRFRQEVALVSGQNADLEEMILTLNDAKQGLEAQNADLSTSLSTAEEGRLRFTDVVEDLEAQNADLSTSLSTAEDARAAAVESAADLDAERLKLAGVVQDLQAENDLVVLTVGDMESLREQVSDLETDIRELEDERRALLPQSHTTEVACTGSMEPTLTCLDSVTVLKNVKAKDIVVGSLLVFDEGGQGGDRVLHRVVDRKIENGIYLYRTQGDANPKPDDYWVSRSWVFGYVIEINRGTHPEKATLRARVNKAREEFYRTQAAYYRKAIEICGSVEVASTNCPTSALGAISLMQSYAAHSRAYCEYESALNEARILRPGEPQRLVVC